MFFYNIDENKIYTQKGEATPGDIEGSYIYPLTAVLFAPPTDEPGKYILNATKDGWDEIDIEKIINNKYDEIILKSNTVKNYLSSHFSILEEDTWPEQEAGARAILDDKSNVKNSIARLILQDEVGTQTAISLVTQLAEIDKCTPTEFATKIVNNADQAYYAGISTLLEQRDMETKLKTLNTLDQLNKFEIKYSLIDS